MKFVLLAALAITTVNANAYFSNNTITCTGKNPNDLIGTLTLDLDSQIFISSKETDGFGDETLGLQKLRTQGGDLVYRAREPEGEFVLTFYIPQRFYPLNPIAVQSFNISLKLWSAGDGDSFTTTYSLICKAKD